MSNLHTVPPTVVLVGRTNVGKSSLFNKMLEDRKALVSHIAGTTRDRNEGICIWRGKMIQLVDTGGLDIEHPDEIEASTMRQAELALKKADVILFVVDLKSGMLPQERELAKRLKKGRKPVILAGNKAETLSERLSVQSPEWRSLGLGAPLAVSAVRGAGVGDLLDAVFEKLEETGHAPVLPAETPAPRIAVIGKPNVGKSTLLNSLTGEERFITSPIAHTTREPNDTLVRMDDKAYVFIDTAGMRKKGRVKKTGGLEAAAVERNERVIRLCDVALLVIDATEPIGVQEKTLAGLLKDSGSGIMIIANKWDLIEDKNTGTMNAYREYIAASIPFLSWAPVLFVSALTRQRVQKIFETIDMVVKNRGIRLDEQHLHDFLKEARNRYRPFRARDGSAPKILGMKQTGFNPPKFDLTMKVKRTEGISQSYIRYMENLLREYFHLEGVPVRIHVRIASAVSD